MLQRRCCKNRRRQGCCPSDMFSVTDINCGCQCNHCFWIVEGHKLSTADASKAYLQSWLESLAGTWVRLPGEIWPASWFNSNGAPRFKRPVTRLLKTFGHPEAGSHWERYLAKELVAMGGVPISEYPSTFTFPTYNIDCLCG